MRLLLVRHGETTWNAEGRYQGRLDTPLSALGKAQAAALAEHIRSERVLAVVSSPLSRAAETAAACAEALGLACTLDERLIEISHGSWEGRLRSEIERDDPERYEQWQRAPETVVFPGGEGLSDVQRRLDAFIASAEAAYGDGVLAVTHDIVVRLAILAAQSRPLGDCKEVEVDNAALTQFQLEGGRLRLVRQNDTRFLGELQSPLGSQAR
ncbi:MAG: histidine phosphatase family protein [Candidatus Eremiobacteraeota bacterium]|nr:histidine phosphatase family protein [Candidatus Eremiobacteraeota bacterium]